MPRAILRLAYKAVPCTPSAAFPTQTKVHIPLLEVAFEYGGKSFRTLGLLDSGAGRTLAPTDIADALGIDWKACPQTRVIGVSGTGMGYAADVQLTVLRANHHWTARVVFTPGLSAVGIPLLGQQGFFDHCVVQFEARKKEFKITI